MEKRFRLTIPQKLAVGFGIVLLIVLASNMFIYRMLIQNRQITKEISENYTPSLSSINELAFIVTNSKMLIRNWVFYDELDNTADKKKLRSMNSIEYPYVKKRLINYSEQWQIDNQKSLTHIIENADILFNSHKEIMNELNSVEKYDIPYFALKYDARLDDINILTDTLIIQLDTLTSRQQKLVAEVNHQMEISFAKFSNRIVLSGIFLLITIVLIAFLTTRTLAVPINRIKNSILLMGKGALPEKPIQTGSDEVGEMGLALNILIDGLKRKVVFALEIGAGNYGSQFEPLSTNDTLGNSLLLMRENLVKASDDAEMRRLENLQRTWASQGLAEFSELVRNEATTIENFTSKTIIKLTKYLDAGIGGLFIVNDDNKDDLFLELTAFYAYDRQKFIKKRIDIGENLVGQCYLENETIYMNDIPKGYINISSGLGKDKPKSLLLVPIKLNRMTYGVIELASFSEIKQYQIDFVEKIGETIASTISNIKINVQTSKLLEESREKSEKLTVQEEESRKNLEKIEAAQAEILLKEKEQTGKFKKIEEEYRSKIALQEKRYVSAENQIKEHVQELNNFMTAVDNSFGVIEIDYKGEILNVNQKYLKMAEITLVELLGKSIEQFMLQEVVSSNDYRKFWGELRNGNSQSIENYYVFREHEKWFVETFNPVKNEDGTFVKVVIMAYDITKSKKDEREFIKQLDLLKES